MSKWKRFSDSVAKSLEGYLVQKPYEGELLSHETIHEHLMKNHQTFPTLPPVESYTTNSFVSFDEDRASHLIVGERFHLFGVYDGHVGSNSSQYLQHLLLQEVQDELLFGEEESISQSLVEAFRTCDKKLIQSEKMSGATAVVTCIDSETNTAYIANTGNCKAVLGIENEIDETSKSDEKGDVWTVETLTFDHLAELEEDKLRKRFPNDEDLIENGKIKGLLDYSRTFGDALFKKGGRMLCGDREDWNPPYVSVDPEVTVLSLDDLEDTIKRQFIVLGSEGIWRNMSPDQVIPIIGKNLQNGEDVTVDVLGGVLEIVAQRGMNFEERVSSVLLTPRGFLKMICQDITVSVIVLDNLKE